MTEYKEALERRKRRNMYLTIGGIIVIAILAIVIMQRLFQGRLESIRAAEAKQAMTEIFLAANKYYRDHGKWAYTLNELEEQGYWTIPEDVYKNWDLYLISNKTIRAISTSNMAGGRGKTVDYHFGTDKFTGYGCSENGEKANLEELLK